MKTALPIAVCVLLLSSIAVSASDRIIWTFDDWTILADRIQEDSSMHGITIISRARNHIPSWAKEARLQLHEDHGIVLELTDMVSYTGGDAVTEHPSVIAIDKNTRLVDESKLSNVVIERDEVFISISFERIHLEDGRIVLEEIVARNLNSYTEDDLPHTTRADDFTLTNTSIARILKEIR